MVVQRIVEVDMNVKDDGKESRSRDSRRAYEVVGQRALLKKQWKQGSFFLEQRLWGCSHIRSGLGVAGNGVAGVSEVGELVWEVLLHSSLGSRHFAVPIQDYYYSMHFLVIKKQLIPIC